MHGGATYGNEPGLWSLKEMECGKCYRGSESDAELPQVEDTSQGRKRKWDRNSKGRTGRRMCSTLSVRGMDLILKDDGPGDGE